MKVCRAQHRSERKSVKRPAEVIELERLEAPGTGEINLLGIGAITSTVVVDRHDGQRCQADRDGGNHPPPPARRVAFGRDTPFSRPSIFAQCHSEAKNDHRWHCVQQRHEGQGTQLLRSPEWEQHEKQQRIDLCQQQRPPARHREANAEVENQQHRCQAEQQTRDRHHEIGDAPIQSLLSRQGCYTPPSAKQNIAAQRRPGNI